VKTGQTAKAKAAYEGALALQPDLSEASNDLGTLLAESGDVPAAIQRFRAALDASPDYPDALNNLGYALLLTGRGPEAQELYERALKLQPDFPEALNNLGLILGRQGELDRAEPYFRKACRCARATGRPRTTSPSSSSTVASPTRRSASCRVPREEPGVREHVPHAGEDLPGHEPETRGAGDDRAPPAAQPRPRPGPRAQAAVPVKPPARPGAGIIRLSRQVRRACA